jgi:hypothetical protein
VKELIRAKRPACTLEAQDFRRDDTELVYVCYRERDKADVFGLDLATGKSTTYLAVEGEYNEVEGVEPGGTWALVESSRDQGADRQDSRHIDLWKLTLVPNSMQFVRMTRWGDWDGYKASNPTVSRTEVVRVPVGAERGSGRRGVRHLSIPAALTRRRRARGAAVATERSRAHRSPRTPRSFHAAPRAPH